MDMNKTDDLEMQLFDGKITRLEFLQRSPEYSDDFKQFCLDYGLTADEQSANKFQDWLLDSKEKAHADLD